MNPLFKEIDKVFKGIPYLKKYKKDLLFKEIDFF